MALAGAALAAPVVRAAELLPLTTTRVVIVGGGFAGAIAAKTLRMNTAHLEVVLVERNRAYSALPGANWVIGGHRRGGENRLSYDRLEARHGVRMIYGEVQSIDAGERRVALAGGTLTYDHLIVAPGISLRTDAIEGYGPETEAACPHAWTSGEQAATLRKQLEDMKDGGLVLLSVPPAPFRCPQAAYERASQIALYLKRSKPRSKLIVLDAGPKPATPLADLFLASWSRDYRGILEYRGNQKLLKADAQRRLTTAGETLRGDVVNLIPPQSAAELAHRAGLVGDDGRWCPVDHTTYESTLVSGVHVIGDACLSQDMQRSASAANAQGKACALNLAATLARRDARPHTFSNVCYSLLDDRVGAAAVVFHRGDGRELEKLDKGGGSSPEWSELEGTYARAWVGAILDEMSS